MHWLYLALAITLELAGTISMKASGGFQRLGPAALMFVFYASCFSFLSLALRKIDVSVAYAIWSGLGTALIGVVGVLWFRESMSPMKIAGLALVIAGVVLLNLGGGHGETPTPTATAETQP
jgi:small multidrug resistance pump